MTTKKVSLTGIKPTGAPHLGNYFGMFRPALRLSGSYAARYFIADYHAITTAHDPAKLRANVLDLTAAWLACGLDPKETLLYRQSAVVEVFELAWVLSCVVATGQLERGHAYKDAVAKGDAPNAGIFFYPVLMAADILLYDTHLVPIGQDQKQHLEIARDMATRLNHLHGEGTVVVPEALISEAPIVPGFDGFKMSKSRGNYLSLFGSSKELRKGVMKFVTGSETLEQPKEPDGAIVFQLYQLVAKPEQVATLAEKLRAGGYGWGHAKQDLYEALDAEITPLREKYEALRADEAGLLRTLEDGEERARAIAQATMRRVRTAVGVR